MNEDTSMNDDKNTHLSAREFEQFAEATSADFARLDGKVRELHEEVLNTQQMLRDIEEHLIDVLKA